MLSIILTAALLVGSNSPLLFASNLNSTEICVEALWSTSTKPEIEILLDQLSQDNRNPKEGVFGPNSMVWRVFRERVVGLGVPASGMLHFSHPVVADVFGDLSYFSHDSYERMQNTLVLTSNLVFGDLHSVKKTARALHAIHKKSLDKTGYDREQMGQLFLWVYASTVSVMLKTYELHIEPLTAREKEQFFEESRILARLVGVPNDLLPHNLADLNEYVENMMASLRFQPSALDFLNGAFYNDNSILAFIPNKIRILFDNNEYMRAMARSVTRPVIYELVPPSVLEKAGIIHTPGWRNRAANLAIAGFLRLGHAHRFSSTYSRAIMRINDQPASIVKEGKAKCPFHGWLKK